MKIQIISRLPSSVAKLDIPGPFTRILQDHLGLIYPVNWQMPGTRIYGGWRVIHFGINAPAADIKWLFDAINDAGILDWRIEAGQNFKIERDSVTGEPIAGQVYKPVPSAMVDWLEDIILYDGDGNPIGTGRPVAGVSMHTYDGADPWVWA